MLCVHSPESSIIRGTGANHLNHTDHTENQPHTTNYRMWGSSNKKKNVITSFFFFLQSEQGDFSSSLKKTLKC